MVFKRITTAVLMCLMLTSSVLCQNIDNTSGNVSKNSGDATESTPEKVSYFSDVALDCEYLESVNKMYEYGIINGYEDKTFRPENGVTRAEMCKMINLSFNYVLRDKATGFPDVTEEKWFYPYVLCAQQAGYIEGYEDGTFRGENTITRQEVCVIINRIVKPMDLSEFGTKVEISDEISDWAKKSVELIVMNSFMPLEENNTFRAKENIKRYELAVLLSRFVVQPAETLTGNVRFFNGENQIGETDTVLIGDYPNVPDAPNPTDNSFEFVGWRVVGQNELTDAKNTMILGDTDYEAVFAKKKFTVNFLDGDTVYETQTVEYGQSVTAKKASPETDGYDFVGWSFTKGGETVKLDILSVTSDINLYAVYKKTQSSESGGGGGGGGGGSSDSKVYYTVTFYVDDLNYSSQEVLSGSKPKKPTDPSVENKIFLGWSKKENGDEDDIVDVKSCTIREETEFYAVFKVNPNDSEMLEMLEKGIEQLNGISLTNTLHKKARKEIVNCMKKVLADAQIGIFIDQEYISTEYETEVETVESIVLDQMTGREASEFKTLLMNNVDKDVQDFLTDYFLDGKDIEL